MSDMPELFDGCLNLLLDDCMTPPRHRALAEKCLRAIKKAAKEHLRNGRAAAFGSLANGFGIFNSDLDVVVQESAPVGATEAHDSVVVLKKIRKALLRTGAFNIVASIWHARVPVLKLRFQDELDVDISANNTAALRNTRLLAAYANLGAEVQGLGVAVKLWARENNLCGAGCHRLSSYALLLMVIYFLQVSGPDPVPCLQRSGAWNKLAEHSEDLDLSPNTAAEFGKSQLWSSSVGVAVLLCGFFHFYAETFRWGHEVVSVRIGQRLDASAREFAALSWSEDFRLHIEDPFDLPRNLRDVLNLRNEEDLLGKLCAAHTSMRDGQHIQVLPPSPSLQVGDMAVVRQSLRDQENQTGYLLPQPGSRVKVLYVGSDDNKDEQNWIFGQDITLGAKGWIARTALILAPQVAGLSCAADSPSSAIVLEKLELQAGRIVVTWEELAEPKPGYLALFPGCSIEVLYVGSEGDDSERGWFYGQNTANHEKGWVSKSAVRVSDASDTALAT